MNVAEAILSRGAESAIAVVYRDSAMTYGELRQKVIQIGTRLLDEGHSKGDRVGILSENSPFYVVAYLGVIRAGLVAVPIPTDASASMISEIIAHTGARSVFVSDQFRKRGCPWAERLGVAVLPESYGVTRAVHSPQSTVHSPPAPDRGPWTVDCGLWTARVTPAFPEIEPSRDLAALLFTSGSTGSPKGVMVTHRNIECNTRDIVAYMGLGAHDRAMVVLPFNYCFGLSLLHTHLMAGGGLVINNEFRLFPEHMLLEMQRQKCTGLAGVPSTYQILLRASRFRDLAFPNLRWLQQAGGKLPMPCHSGNPAVPSPR